jgi:hypothetical protein
MVCPKCKENTAHRVAREGFYDQTANLFFFKPYSCTACSHRFRVLRLDLGVAALRAAMEERRMRFRSRKNWKRIRRDLMFYGFGALAMAAVIYYITRQRA